MVELRLLVSRSAEKLSNIDRVVARLGGTSLLAGLRHAAG